MPRGGVGMSSVGIVSVASGWTVKAKRALDRALGLTPPVP